MMLTSGLILFSSVVALVAHGVESKLVLTLHGQTVDAIEGPFKMPGDRYIAQVGFGSQLMNISINTCFSDLFVPERKSSGESQKSLHFDAGFDASASTHLNRSISNTLTYTNANLLGNWVQDKIELDPKQSKNKLSFSGTFFVANHSNIDFSHELWDGVFGLGPRENSSYPGPRSLVRTLKDQRVIDKAHFGLWFSPPWEKESRFELILGDLDVKRVKDMEIFSSIYKNKEVWSVNLAIVWLNGQPIGCQFKKCRATLDTSVSGTYGPKQQVMQLYSALGLGSDQAELTNTYVDCDSVPRDVKLQFTFMGRDRVFPSEYFIRESSKQDGSRVCYVNVYPNETEDQWTLGTSFLSAYYTAYDLERDWMMIAH